MSTLSLPDECQTVDGRKKRQTKLQFRDEPFHTPTVTHVSASFTSPLPGYHPVCPPPGYHK
eukprot:1648586-Rhodomonas_salina.1